MSRIIIRNENVTEARTMMGKLLSDFARNNGLTAKYSQIRGFDIGKILYGPAYINFHGPFCIFDEKSQNLQNPILEIDIFEKYCHIPNSRMSDNIVEGVLIKLEDEQRKDICSELFRKISNLGDAFKGTEILSALARKSVPLSDAEYDKSAKLLDDKDWMQEHIKKDFEIVPEIFYDSHYVKIAERHGLRALETTLETIEKREPKSYNKFSEINRIQCSRFDKSIFYFYNSDGILAAQTSITKGGAHTYHNQDFHFRQINLIDRTHQDDFVRDFLSTFDFQRGGVIEREDGQEIRTEIQFGRLVYTDIADTEGKSVPVTHRNLTF